MEHGASTFLAVDLKEEEDTYSLIPKLFLPHSHIILASFPHHSCLIPKSFLPHSHITLASVLVSLSQYIYFLPYKS